MIRIVNGLANATASGAGLKDFDFQVCATHPSIEDSDMAVLDKNASKEGAVDFFSNLF
ncbi:MAG TPA: hypothetical protein VGF77_09405 [Allosphingosinicella sp.]